LTSLAASNILHVIGQLFFQQLSKEIRSRWWCFIHDFNFSWFNNLPLNTQLL